MPIVAVFSRYYSKNKLFQYKAHQYMLIDGDTEQSDINALLSASSNYMLERQEASCNPPSNITPPA